MKHQGDGPMNAKHIHLENNILFPAAVELEKHMAGI